MRISARLLKKTLLRTDERAKLEGELLDGIDVVKCMTWEVSLLPYKLSLHTVHQDVFWIVIRCGKDLRVLLLVKMDVFAAIFFFLLARRVGIMGDWWHRRRRAQCQLLSCSTTLVK